MGTGWRTVIACATVSLGVCPTAGAAGVTTRALGSIRPTLTRVVDEAMDPPGFRLLRGGVPVIGVSGARPARLTLTGDRSSAPGFQRSEARITWSLGEHLAVQLNYARTVIEPFTRGDHDDGVLTRLRLGF